MAEHPKSKAMGGFYQADGSPCTYPYLHFEELEGDGDILQLLGAEDWLLVVPGEPLSGEDLEEGDELEAVAEVDLEVVDLLVGLLQVLVRPSRERVLGDHSHVTSPQWTQGGGVLK